MQIVYESLTRSVSTGVQLYVQTRRYLVLSNRTSSTGLCQRFGGTWKMTKLCSGAGRTSTNYSRIWVTVWRSRAREGESLAGDHIISLQTSRLTKGEVLDSEPYPPYIFPRLIGRASVPPDLYRFYLYSQLIYRNRDLFYRMLGYPENFGV